MLRGDSVPSFKHDRVTPAQIIILGFLLLIFTGAVLLMLPFSTQEPGGASFGDALFTATSATCVTGLVLHDTALYWSPFGQLVILLLIQVGGMGVVTIAVAIFMFAGKRIGLKQRWVMQESISAPQVGGIVRMTGFILKTAFLIEGVGVLLLALRFCPQFGLGRGLWYAVFHSVSAFCNAGFDLMGVNSPFSSLTDYVGDPLVSNVIAFLIIIGGVGFLTWNDIREHKLHFRRYRLQSKLILTTTLALILTGLLFFLLYVGGHVPVGADQRRVFSVRDTAHRRLQHSGSDWPEPARPAADHPADAGGRFTGFHSRRLQNHYAGGDAAGDPGSFPP